MPVFWGCDWDLSTRTKSHLRDCSEQCTDDARAHSRSHGTNTSLTFGAALQVWGSHSCWWRLEATGAAEKVALAFHVVTGTSQLLTRLGDTALMLHLQVLPQGSVLLLPYPLKSSLHQQALVLVHLVFLLFCHCICYSLLIYELL